MKNTILAMSSLLLASLVVAGCSEEDTEPTPDAGAHETVKSELARDTTPDNDPAVLAQLSAGNRAFTMDLYRTTTEPGTNYMVSGWSIQQAFALTWAGAVGETAQQMADTLYFTDDQATTHSAMNAFDLALSSRELPATDEEEAVELRVANAFWGQTGYPWAAPFLDTIALNYGAGVESVDFEADAEAGRQLINAWVEDRTRDRIKDLLPEGSISADTAAVLTNAVYFRAPWLHEFNEDATADGTFTLADGSTISTALMTQLESHAFASGEGWSAAELAFRGEELAMTFILPTPGTFDTFDAAFDAAVLDEVLAALQPAQVRITLPKFEFETEFTLSDALKELGMVIPFDGGADFSGMLPGGGLFIDEAFHKTFIAVEEGGAEAAAATAVVVGETSVPVEDAVFAATSPFYFAIRDRDTGLILFFGRVMNPAE